MQGDVDYRKGGKEKRTKKSLASFVEIMRFQ